ncbi:hypothetical protein ACEPPN_006715 [Leptodophora sp. 'Broadleaf-Isolate-01']
MSEAMPRAAPQPDMSTPSDVFSPYITLPETPPSFGSYITAHQPIGASHSHLVATLTATQVPTDGPKKDESSSPPRKRRKGGKIFSKLTSLSVTNVAQSVLIAPGHDSMYVEAMKTTPSQETQPLLLHLNLNLVPFLIRQTSVNPNPQSMDF